MIKDEEASLADPTASPAMSDTKDTQSSPMETSPADHITVPLAETECQDPEGPGNCLGH